VVERFTTVVRGEKPKVKKTTEMVGAWKTNLVGRTNTVSGDGKNATIFGEGKQKLRKQRYKLEEQRQWLGELQLFLEEETYS
jgi:hypothetical protein